MVKFRIQFTLFALLLLIFVHAENLNCKQPARRFMDMEEKQVNQTLEKSQTYPVDEKISFVSSFFINTPYSFDPLGEGKDNNNGDKDPLFRLDKVDCLTMLEEIWGMLWSDNLSEASRITQQIRYKNGKIAYKNRHHLMWGQWLYENEKKGYIEDITNKILPNAAVLETKTFGKHTCSGKWTKFCKNLGENMPEGKFSRYVLPIEKIKNNLDKIPHGVFIFIVMKNRNWLPYRIKHSGLIIIDDKGTPVLRHASTHHKKVIDVPLSRYIEMLETKSKNWSASGLILVKPLPPPENKNIDKQD